MMHLCWFTLLLCLSASAESKAVWRVSGESVTLKCSFAGCSNITKGYDGMYLYQDAEERAEVFYYHPNPGSTDKITPGTRYTDRIQTNGSLKYHTITISNLTVDDSGFYKCVFIKFPGVEDECSVYTLFIRGEAPCSESAVVALALTNEKSPPLVLILIAACTITLLVTMIFILLIVPMVSSDFPLHAVIN
ncbi:uncharacterized protein LOC141764844 [Sebastes fasciatus]|uniref:uncharacterized protein LOC141764844 n=1 Tax=Sebastes fasciatus TaxID=394691 RepID=UPI003D9E65D2